MTAAVLATCPDGTVLAAYDPDGGDALDPGTFRAWRKEQGYWVEGFTCQAWPDETIALCQNLTIVYRPASPQQGHDAPPIGLQSDT